jgi:pseudaminic acid cytidylyltransferase
MRGVRERKRWAIIPARGGSTRIPGKNKRLFCGKAIIEYSIEAAKDCGLFDHIVVSSDDDDILWYARGHSCVASRRPTWLCDNDVGTQQVGAMVVMQEKAALGMPTEVCIIYATAPMLCAGDLLRGWEVMDDQAVEYAMSVGTDPLRDAAQFYWCKWNALKSGIPLISEYTAMIPIDEHRVCDINTEDDWQRAERMYRFLYPAEAA